MANRCDFCDQRTDTNMLVLNEGAVWIEFCASCGATETLTNAVTGETLTVQALFDRAGNADAVSPVNVPEEPYNEYGDLDAIACANGDYNTFEENEVWNDREWDE